MVPGIRCITQDDIGGIKCLRPEIQWPGWWCKMNAYNPALFDDDMLLIDLDTTVFRLPKIPTVTTVLPDFYRPELIGSGFMYVTAEDRKKIWQQWMRDPQLHMRRNRTRQRWGDQGFLMDIIGSSARWGDNVVSWKVHCTSGVPPAADVICFHGKPRPWEVWM